MIRLYYCPRDRDMVAHTNEHDACYVQQLLACAMDRDHCLPWSPDFALARLRYGALRYGTQAPTTAENNA